MQQRHLSFTPFLASRVAQIQKFTQILAIPTIKRTHQALPKSIRRRAMSHNRYRIPIKMRKNFQGQLIKAESMQRLPKCRKSIRKRHRLIVSYKQRSGKVRWLATHLWASKRMRMGIHAGYKVAMEPNNKSFRSAYRNFRHNACLIDCSYLQCLKIKQKTPKTVLPPQIHQKSSQNPAKFQQGDLYSQQNKLICPILIIPQSSQIIRCLFDPFALQQVQKIKWNAQQYQIQISKSKCDVYLLLGPQAFGRVKQVINGIGGGNVFGGSDGVLESFNRQIMHIGQGKQEVQVKIPLISSNRNETIVQKYDPANNRRLRDLFFQNLQKTKQKQRQHQVEKQEGKNRKFWNFYEQLEVKLSQKGSQVIQYISNVSTRSKYTHKRKNKLTKEQKKKVLIQQSSQKRQKTPQKQTSNKKSTKKEQQQQQPPQQAQKQGLRQDKKSRITNEKMQQVGQQKMEQQVQKTKQFQVDPILLLPFHELESKGQMWTGCFLLCGYNDNCRIWRMLTQTNVKVIGRKELRHCYFQAGRRFFPDDYPQTPSFSTYNKQRAVQLFTKHRRYPLQKRPNYKKLHSPSPFFFQLPTNTPNSIKISMISRGRCFPGSYICRLNPQDYTLIAKQIEQKGIVRSLVEEQKQISNNETIKDVDYNMTCQMVINELQGVCTKKMKREIIGFVTYGGFSFNLGRQAGLGYLFQSFVEEEPHYVLIRKTTSRFYHAAIITKQ